MKPTTGGKAPAAFSKEAVAVGLDEWYYSSRAYCDIPITDDSILDDTLPSLSLSAAKALPNPKAIETAMKYYLSGKWRLTKVVYTTDPIFMDALSDSESTALYTAILRRLPFRTFYLHCPREDSLGLLIHVEPYENENCLLVAGIIFQDQTELACKLISLPFQNGETPQQALDHLILSMHLTGPSPLAPSKPDDMIAGYAQSLMEALSFSYYLASQDADIRPVRTSKEQRCRRSNGTPLRIREWEIGFRVGCTIAQMYRRRPTGHPPAASAPEPTGIKRPHVRRAHWHHYWTGKGRSVLVVKWLFPTIIHGDPDKLIPISHGAPTSPT